MNKTMLAATLAVDGHTAWNVGDAVAGNDRTIGAGVGYSW